MFKKFMAKLGVGSAKIDFILKKTEYRLGEVVEGEFKIEGGSVDQEINQINVDLTLRMNLKGKEWVQSVAQIPVCSAFVIRANEQKTIPFTYRLPGDLPISRGSIAYSFTTRLDIAAGVDHLDRDDIRVLPPERFDQLIRALDLLGFREKMDSGKFNGYGQKFEFFPTVYFKDRLSELELIPALEEDGIRLLLELDLMPAFGFGEKELKREVFFSNEELADIQILAGRWQKIIEEMLEHPHEYPASRYAAYHGGHHGWHGGGLAGAMGGFAAGMLGGMLLEDLLFEEEEAEAAEEDADLDDGGFDFFGGDDGEF